MLFAFWLFFAISCCSPFLRNQIRRLNYLGFVTNSLMHVSRFLITAFPTLGVLVWKILLVYVFLCLFSYLSLLTNPLMHVSSVLKTAFLTLGVLVWKILLLYVFVCLLRHVLPCFLCFSVVQQSYSQCVCLIGQSMIMQPVCGVLQVRGLKNECSPGLDRML